MKKENDESSIKWQKVSLSVLCAVLALILIILLFGTIYAHYLLGQFTSGTGDRFSGTLSPEDLATATDEHDPNFTGPSVDHGDINIDVLPSAPERNNSEGIINILLIGEDRRPGEPRQRSDSMILCSFNTNTDTLTMISFLRDTYVYIPDHGNNKLNAAYQFGGAELLDETLSVNFGVHVDGNIMIDFDGFTSVINLLGGVDITLTEKEAAYLNEVNGWNLTVGLNHLDGEKALAYSRIRKIDMDAVRAQRQRTVLTSLINAYKNQSVGSMVSTATEILDMGIVETDMSSNEILGYIWDLFPLLASAQINNQQIPAVGTYTEMTVGTITATKVADLEENRTILKEILEN